MQFDVTAQPADEAELPERLLEIHDYWVSLRGDGWAPRWDSFKLLDLKPATIPFMVVMDVQSDPLDFVYRFWGTGNTASIGYDCTGQSVRDNRLFSDKVFRECSQLLQERRPIVWFSKVMREDGVYREYARLRAPMTVDGETISHIISGVYINEKLSDLFEGMSS